MKQQQVQAMSAVQNAKEFDIIEAAAIRNFEARNVRGDRVWSKDRIDPLVPALELSERERMEFIEHARHQLGRNVRKPAVRRSVRLGIGEPD